MFKGLLREPLLHFLLIGALLFVIYSIQNDSNGAASIESDKQIIISEVELDRLAAMWEKRRQRPPLPHELDGLIQFRIREEVLNREALLLGLDKDDGVIRRRLAQKMEFLFSDIATLAEPSDEILEAYLKRESEKFEIPGRISFEHLFFNTDQRGIEPAREEASQLKLRLATQGAELDIESSGDGFMPGHRFVDLAEWELARIFGSEFSGQLFTLLMDGWQGPVASSYGYHLVRIQNRTEPRAPALEEVRDKVKSEWEAEQRREMNDAFYQELREQYTVVIEGQGELQ